jgi:hypothetical protein
MISRMEADMSDYSVLFDVAKVQQEEVARQAEAARFIVQPKPGRKSYQTVKHFFTHLLDSRQKPLAG